MIVVDPIIADDIKPRLSSFLLCRVVPGDQAVHPAHISASIVMINSTDIERSCGDEREVVVGGQREREGENR